MADALVALVRRAAPAPGAPRVYNVASGRETTVLDVAGTLCRWHGGRTAVPLGASASRSGVHRSCGDASRLRLATDWRPRVGWEQSLREMWEHLRGG